MDNERAFLARLSAATPDKLLEAARQADSDERRILRIALGEAQFDSIAALGAGPRGAPMGNVVVLHGIMGGELTQFTSTESELIWVNIWHLLEGQFSRLALDKDSGLSLQDVRASGIYLRYYAHQLVSLSQNWNVRPFFFDWRRDMRVSAAALRQLIDSAFGPATPVHLVAHSMGGLVARCFIAKNPDRWASMADPDNLRQGGRLVMLGTPNYGAFAIPRLLYGLNDVLSLVSKIDLCHNLDDLLAIAATFPGVFQMLPALGHLPGLELLYRAASYTRVPVAQNHLDDALAFQNELAPADPARMVYVAGYDRATAAKIVDASQMGANSSYSFTKYGDGTVTHALGLLPSVTSYFADTDHQSLPQFPAVMAAMNDLLATGVRKDDPDLLTAPPANLDSSTRGNPGDEEAARESAKAALIADLRASLQGRGAPSPDSITQEEQTAADLMFLHDVRPASPSAGSEPSSVSAIRTTPPRTQIRVYIAETQIQDILPGAVPTESRPIDCLATGHYLRVYPTGSERDLDRVLTAAYRHQDPKDIAEEDLLLTQCNGRGVLRGELGEQFLLPDPRPTHPGVLIAIPGMGPIGSFGAPELSVLSHDLCWTLGQLGKKHLALVLIGASKKNLSVPDAVHALLAGLNRALAAAPNGAGLEAITFVTRPEDAQTASLADALGREVPVMAQTSFNMDVQLPGLSKPTEAQASEDRRPRPATRIAVEFDGGVCRYSVLTGDASLAARDIAINPKRIAEINARLLEETDPAHRYRLGRFLLDFLFPHDLLPQLAGASPIVLACNNGAAQVFWELAAQPSPDGLYDPAAGPHLGLARGLTRQLRTVLAPPPEPPPPSTRTLRVLIVADGWREHPLPGAQREARELMALFDKFNRTAAPNRIDYTALIGPAAATPLNVLLAIDDQPPFDLLHYAGHCFFDPEHPSDSGFLFTGGDILNAGDLDRIDRVPRFVFSNACESGVMPSRPDLGSPALAPSFAEEFFKKGVANFICTAWPVADSAALAFALALYDNLLGTNAPAAPMWQSMREARQAIAATPSWAAYQHYGNPYFQLFRAR